MVTSAVESCLPYADFRDWSAADYLAEYYSTVMEDERHTIEFLVDALRRLPEVPLAIDVGAGPCVHHAFPLAIRAKEIHCADFVAGNRAEIERWIQNRDEAHDWRAFAAVTLELEGIAPTDEAVRMREMETRRRLAPALFADVRSADPLGPAYRGSYPLVTSHYCVEAISTDKDVFRSNMKNVASLVAPGGTLIVSACGAADFYRVGERNFPCSGVTGEDVLRSMLAIGFRDVDLRVRTTPSHTSQGYSSVIFARGRRPHG
jgi:hypothetical protein